MKALVFEKSGLNNLRLQDVSEPDVRDYEVLIRVQMAGVNPIDYFAVTGIRQVKPIPHIPGAEFAGIVEKVGSHVNSVKPGDRVVVYNRVFDGTCDMCISGYEMVCKNGGIVGVITNGGFAQYVSVPEKNLVKIPDEISWEMAASLPVSALTSYHALKESNVKLNDIVVVFGASGNTGMFAVQLAKMMGATVIAVSRKSWLKDLGADYVTDYSSLVNLVEKVSNGRMADIIINALGAETWDYGLQILGTGGKIVVFGVLTGGEVKMSISSIYSKHASIIGTTGGTRKELHDLVNICRKCKVKVWKKFKLEEGRSALELLFSKERDGRIMIEI